MAEGFLRAQGGEFPKGQEQGLPLWSGVKNLPSNTGDMGSITGLGRFHMPRGNKAGAPQLERCPQAATKAPACCNEDPVQPKINKYFKRKSKSTEWLPVGHGQTCQEIKAAGLPQTWSSGPFASFLGGEVYL